MKTEIQETKHRYFYDLKIFTRNEINKSLDEIYSLILDNFGQLENRIKVCGSVAKMLDGALPIDYEPKDIDILIDDPITWRFLQANFQKINCKNIEIQGNRMILTYKTHIIELWRNRKTSNKEGVYLSKIKYCFI